MLPEIIQRQKLFSLLHNIDVDLAEGVRSLGCPTVRDHCTLPPTSANRVVVPLAYLKHSPFAIVFAAVAKVASASDGRHNFALLQSAAAVHQ